MERDREKEGGSRLKEEEENDSKRERKKAEGSGKGVESRIVRARRRQTAVKRGGERISKRERGFVEENKKSDLEIKDGKKNGQVRKG